MNVITKSTGIALAIAAASLVAGCNNTKPDTASASVGGNIHCYGVNKCGGHNDCKTADNACKGHAACKGHGFLKMSEHACSEVGGKVGA
jgi:uncharacterized membrane protein